MVRNRGTEFPKHIYHKVMGTRIVQDQKEQDKLGKEWGETPYPSVESIEQSEQMGGVERLTVRVEFLERLFDKLRTRKDIDKLLSEVEA
jgi:hypothetical protein